MNTKRRIPNELKLKDVKITKPEIDFEKTREDYSKKLEEQHKKSKENWNKYQREELEKEKEEQRIKDSRIQESRFNLMRKRWEYINFIEKYSEVPEPFQTKWEYFEHLGQEGWELIEAISSKETREYDVTEYIFKREKYMYREGV